MKKYERPILELVELVPCDVIRTSGEPVVGGGIKLGGDSGWGDENGDWRPVN